MRRGRQQSATFPQQSATAPNSPETARNSPQQFATAPKRPRKSPQQSRNSPQQLATVPQQLATPPPGCGGTRGPVNRHRVGRGIFHGQSLPETTMSLGGQRHCYTQCTTFRGGQRSWVIAPASGTRNPGAEGARKSAGGSVINERRAWAAWPGQKSQLAAKNHSAAVRRALCGPLGRCGMAPEPE